MNNSAENSEHVQDTPPTKERRPGEFVFAIILCVASAVLLWNAYGISNFEALSAPGTIPMITTLIMLISAIVIAAKTYPRPRNSSENFFTNILPPVVIFFMFMIVAYAILLKPLGFLPTSFLFLITTIKVLAKRSWLFTIGVSFFVLLLIWLVFRVVFTVLIPPGIVPEGEILQYFRNMLKGA